MKKVKKRKKRKKKYLDPTLFSFLFSLSLSSAIIFIYEKTLHTIKKRKHIDRIVHNKINKLREKGIKGKGI